MSGVDMSEVMNLLNGSRMSVLNQLNRGNTDIPEIADEIGGTETSVRTAYSQLKSDGYIENGYGEPQLTSKALTAIEMADNAASTEEPVKDYDSEIREVKNVNTEFVMYRGGLVYEGSPDELENFEEGQYSEITESGTYMGMKRVDILNHPVRPEE